MPTIDLPDHRHRPDLRRDPPSPRLPEKRNSRLLSFFLRAVIMAVVTSCFFLFVGAAAVILLLLQLFLSSSASRHRRRFPSYGDSGAGFSREDLRKLPRVRYAAPARDPAQSGADCAVCLSDLVDGELCRFLPGCNHKFHANCIDKWLMKTPLCPICRGRVRLPGDPTAASRNPSGCGSAVAHRC